MKSRITLNDKKRTHFKIYPIKTVEFKQEEASEFYDKLNSDLSTRHYIRSNKYKGYKVGVWTIDDKSILTLCLVNEFKTQNCSIWIAPADDLNDLLAMAKFLSNNYESIVSDFKNQIIEGKEELDQFIKNSVNSDNNSDIRA